MYASQLSKKNAEFQSVLHRKSVKATLARDKYAVYGISSADLASAPWQDNTAAVVVVGAAGEGFRRGSGARDTIMDFASERGGKVLLIG